MLNNLQLIWFHVKESLDQLTYRLTDPRNVSRQILKEFNHQIKELEDAYYEIHTKSELLVLNIDESNKEQVTWKNRIKAALQNGNEMLAQQAAIEATKHKQLVDRYVVQHIQLEPLKDSLFEEIQKRKLQRDTLETEIEILSAEYSIAKANDKISRLINGAGTQTNIYDRVKEFKTEVKKLQAQSNARSKVAQQLTSNNTEDQFRQLEAKSGDEMIVELLEEARKELKLIK